MTHTLRSPRKSSASEAVEDEKKERRQPTPSSSSTGPKRGQKRSRAQGLLRTSGPAVQLSTGQPVLQRQAGERKTDTGISVKEKTSSGQKSTTETPKEQGKPVEGKKSTKDAVQSKGKDTTGEKSKSKKSTGEKSSESKESSDSGGACALTTYSTTNFTGEDITADTEFTDSLDTIDGYASTEGVKVHVTDSFRAKGETPKGTVVEPATKSNHLAGHAINMNVWGDRQVLQLRQAGS
jgi:hypothetical protein